ncbi:hypothetical protein T10_1172 [Trichinella papuae]|uniref:Uncharacterized protein n=1 Tax=Trichinella papuae TaxID=268474 RepID=A0A0V1MA95_9BILA|nr:hypothetical protein T10_1172 [Trichinella papuae]
MDNNATASGAAWLRVIRAAFRKFHSPSFALAGSSTTSLATGLVTSPLEIQIWATRSIPSRPVNSLVITLIRQRARGRWSSTIITKSSMRWPDWLIPHLWRGSSVMR